MKQGWRNQAVCANLKTRRIEAREKTLKAESSPGATAEWRMHWTVVLAAMAGMAVIDHDLLLYGSVL